MITNTGGAMNEGFARITLAPQKTARIKGLSEYVKRMPQMAKSSERRRRGGRWKVLFGDVVNVGS
jgi:hypothetical protein